MDGPPRAGVDGTGEAVGKLGGDVKVDSGDGDAAGCADGKDDGAGAKGDEGAIAGGNDEGADDGGFATGEGDRSADGDGMVPAASSLLEGDAAEVGLESGAAK